MSLDYCRNCPRVINAAARGNYYCSACRPCDIPGTPTAADELIGGRWVRSGVILRWVIDATTRQKKETP